MIAYPTVGEVIEAHARLIARFGGSFGIRDRNPLESALARPRTGYYLDLIEAAAALLKRVDFLPREEAFKIPDLIRTKINLLPPGIQTVRTIDIVGVDLQADGGTHVANTREVGAIRIVKTENKGRENKRIEIAVD